MTVMVVVLVVFGGSPLPITVTTGPETTKPPPEPGTGWPPCELPHWFLIGAGAGIESGAYGGKRRIDSCQSVYPSEE
jgi:hypothetical protein